MEYTLTFTKPDGRSESIQVRILSFVFGKIEERLPLIKKNKETITITFNNESTDFPNKGSLFSKDLMKRLDYILVVDVYEYYISTGKVEKFGDYVKVKYTKVTDLGRFFNFNQFATFLYTEGYIDEKPKQLNINKNGN